jgi:hypothetical protein
MELPIRPTNWTCTGADWRRGQSDNPQPWLIDPGKKCPVHRLFQVAYQMGFVNQNQMTTTQ